MTSAIDTAVDAFRATVVEHGALAGAVATFGGRLSKPVVRQLRFAVDPNVLVSAAVTPAGVLPVSSPASARKRRSC